MDQTKHTGNLGVPDEKVYAVPDLLPASMLNAYVYCPRLFYLQWVESEFQDNAFTVNGRYQHRRVDLEGGSVPGPKDAEAEAEDTCGFRARSLTLSSPSLGAIARMDLVEAEAGEVVPVEYKSGTMPSNGGEVWENDKVQLCLRGLILRDNGFTCTHGIVYFTESKTRVPVAFDDALVTRTLELLSEARNVAAGRHVPPPLVDSPRCSGCSLVGICLPDEVNLLSGQALIDDAGSPDVRRLIPARPDALPVYVQAQGASVHKYSEELEIRAKDIGVERVRLIDVSQLSVFGNVQITTQAIRELSLRGIPICYFTYGGWFYAMTQGLGHKNIEIRKLQFQAAMDPGRRLNLARQFIKGKMKNCRTLLRRNGKEVPNSVLDEFSRLIRRTDDVESP